MWKRPESVPLGKVWRRFQGRERNGRPARMYQIRDMDEEYKGQCLDLMLDSFLRDEPLVKALNVASDPVSVSSITSNWLSFMSQQISLACFVEEDGEPTELVAFNFLVVKCKDSEEDMYLNKGEPWKKLLKTLDTAEELVDVYKHYNVDKYLTSSGLTVLPSHRGQNIGAEVFKAREPLCKALGIEATATVFTAITSQVLAAKCGYELLAELRYSDMIEHGIDLSDCESKTAKVMGTKF